MNAHRFNSQDNACFPSADALQGDRSPAWHAAGKKLLIATLFGTMALTSSAAMADRRHGHGGHSGHGVSLGIAIGVGIPLLVGAAYAYPRHSHPPVYYPPVYYPPVYYPSAYFPSAYYPPVVVVPAAPPVVIEQRVERQYSYAPPAPIQVPAPAATQYWYWCADPQGYYPHVAQCATQWQRVSPGSPPG